MDMEILLQLASRINSELAIAVALTAKAPPSPRAVANVSDLVAANLAQVDADAAALRHTPPVIVYAIPGAPPAERIVTGKTGRKWQRLTSGMWRAHDMEPGGDPKWRALQEDLEWVDLLQMEGPLTLDDLDAQDQADAELYGPPGARWGHPDIPCPYVEYGDAIGAPDIVCELGLNHAGPHKRTGYPMGQTQVSATPLPPPPPKGVCECGHPEAHTVGCPRYPYPDPRQAPHPLQDWP